MLLYGTFSFVTLIVRAGRKFFMFKGNIYSIAIKKGISCDELCMSYVAGGSFSSLRAYIDLLDLSNTFSWWKLIWNKHVTPKHIYIFYFAPNNVLPILDNFTHRGFAIVNHCSLCCCAMESVDHLFSSCAFAYNVWAFSLGCMGISRQPYSLMGKFEPSQLIQGLGRARFLVTLAATFYIL